MVYAAWIYQAFGGYRAACRYSSFVHEKWFPTRIEAVEWVASEM